MCKLIKEPSNLDTEPKYKDRKTLEIITRMVESYEKQRQDLIKDKNKFYISLNYYTKKDINNMDSKLLKLKMCKKSICCIHIKYIN